MRSEDVELRMWAQYNRGGQQVTRTDTAVMAVHTPTGIAVVVGSERSQRANQVLAVERLAQLVDDGPGADWRMQ